MQAAEGGDTVGCWYDDWKKIIDRGNQLDTSIREWYFANKRRQFFGRNLRNKQYRIAQTMAQSAESPATARIIDRRGGDVRDDC